MNNKYLIKIIENIFKRMKWLVKIPKSLHSEHQTPYWNDFKVKATKRLDLLVVIIPTLGRLNL